MLTMQLDAASSLMSARDAQLSSWRRSSPQLRRGARQARVDLEKALEAARGERAQRRSSGRDRDVETGAASARLERDALANQLNATRRDSASQLAVAEQRAADALQQGAQREAVLQREKQALEQQLDGLMRNVAEQTRALAETAEAKKRAESERASSVEAARAREKQFVAEKTSLMQEIGVLRAEKRTLNDQARREQNGARLATRGAVADALFPPPVTRADHALTTELQAVQVSIRPPSTRRSAKAILQRGAGTARDMNSYIEGREGRWCLHTRARMHPVARRHRTAAVARPAAREVAVQKLDAEMRSFLDQTQRMREELHVATVEKQAAERSKVSGRARRLRHCAAWRERRERAVPQISEVEAMRAKLDAMKSELSSTIISTEEERRRGCSPRSRRRRRRPRG